MKPTQLLQFCSFISSRDSRCAPPLAAIVSPSAPKSRINAIKLNLARQQRSPFILVIAFVEPHSPYNGPLNDERPLSEIDLDFTATLPESENIPLRYRLMREWQQTEAVLDRGRLPIQLFFGITPEEYRSIKQRYLGLVTLVDQSIGAILESLERCGLTDDTIVVHTSDHGDSLGAHHLFGKEVMFEEAARLDSVAWSETRPSHFASGQSHRLRADIARPLRSA